MNVIKAIIMVVVGDAAANPVYREVMVRIVGRIADVGFNIDTADTRDPNATPDEINAAVGTGTLYMFRTAAREMGATRREANGAYLTWVKVGKPAGYMAARAAADAVRVTPAE